MKKKLIPTLGFIILCMTLVLIHFHHTPQSESIPLKYQQLIHLGQVQMEYNHYKAAADYFNEAFELEPQLDIALIHMAEAYLLADDPDKGIEAINQALLINGSNNSTREYIIAGQLLKNLGLYDDAKANLMIAYTRDHKNQDVLLHLASIYIEENNPDSAIHYYDKLIKYHNLEEAYVRKLRLLESNLYGVDFHTSALLAYKEHPNNFEIASFYGLSLVKTLEEESALNHYKDMISVFHHDLEAYKLYVNYLCDLSRSDEAINYIKSLDLSSQDLNFLEFATQTIRQYQGHDQAVAFVDSLDKEMVAKDITSYLMGILYYDSHYYYESLQYFETAAQTSNNFKVFDHLLDALAKSDRLYKYDYYAQITIDMFDHDLMVKEQLANNALNLGNYDQAIYLLEEIYLSQEGPKHIPYLLAETYYYYIEDYDKALYYLNLYEPQNNEYDTYANQLRLYVTGHEDETDVDFISEVFDYYYLYDYDQSILDGYKGNLSDEEMDLLFNSLKKPDDDFTFFIYGDDYSETIHEDMNFTYKQLKENVHYISFDLFNQNAGYKFIEQVDTIRNQENSILILDLRDNSGGYLSAAQTLIDSMLGQVTTFELVYSDQSTYQYYSDESKAQFKEVYLLQNKYSASAAEVVALSLKTHLTNLTIVGEASYGKNVGQQSFDDKTKERLYYIVNFYWHVNNKTINGTGVQPDIFIENTKIDDFMKDLLKLPSI